MPSVKFFGLSYCVHCKHAKAFLDQHNVPYDLVYVDTLDESRQSDVMKEVGKYNPNLSFPTLLIGDRVIVGFQKDAIASALGI